MDFLKRIFSIRSRRNRRKRQNIKFEQDLGRIQEEDQEAVANRLLRSASARLAVSEPVFSSLPPLPHPINNVLLTPADSTVSLASTVKRGTYTVTVRTKPTHPSQTTATDNPLEFTTVHKLQSDPPHKPLRATIQIQPCTQVPPTPHLLPTTPHNQKYLGLRSDPSVASLLNMYDEHGHLDSEAFSNTPPDKKECRTQTRRNGSTLRQLLGGSSSMRCRDAMHNSALEGDISWAERYLDERLSMSSSTSSLGLQTPKDETPYSHHYSTRFSDQNSKFISRPRSRTLSDSGNYRAISSLEVELSTATSTSLSLCNIPLPFSTPELPPKTPQCASQIFSFLTDRTKARLQDRPLPTLPASSRFSPDSSSENASGIPDANDTSMHSSENLPDDTFRLSRSRSARPVLDSSASERLHGDLFVGLYPVNRARSQSTSARDMLLDHSHSSLVAASSILRGPRLPSSHPSVPARATNNHPPYLDTPRDALGERVNADMSRSTSYPNGRDDRFNRALSRQEYHKKASSAISLGDTLADTDAGERKEKSGRRSEKEDTVSDSRFLSAQHMIPITPIRTHSHAHSRAFFAPPSPASSSELSPVAKQIMSNLREKKAKARERGRRFVGF